MDEDEKARTETDLVVKEWRTVIETQMHFNEMILRARTTGVSVVVGVYGAAVLALGQTPEKVFPMFGRGVPVAALIIAFGVLLLLSIFILDFFYYYELLLGAVERGEEIDKAYEGREIDRTRLFGLTRTISKRVTRTRAFVSLSLFYLLPFLAGVAAIIYLIFCYEATTAAAAVQP